MRSYGQTDIDVSPHGNTRRSDLGPGCTVGRFVAGEGAAAPDHPDPLGDRIASPRRMLAGSAGGGPALKGNAIADSDRAHGMGRPGGQVFPDHYARFSPGIGILQARYPGVNLTVSGYRLIYEMERVSGSPDISTITVNRKNSA